MRKKILTILIALIVIMTCVLIYPNILHKYQKNLVEISFSQELKDDGYKVDIKEYPKSRSDDLPYSKTPCILIVNEEEWFVFTYSSSKEANEVFQHTETAYLNDCYLKEQYIIYYIGRNSDMKMYLKSITQ